MPTLIFRFIHALLFSQLISGCIDSANRKPAFPYLKPETDIQISWNSSSKDTKINVYDLKTESINGEVILFQVENQPQGLTMVDSQVTGIITTYEKMTAPYAGPVTQEVRCDTHSLLRTEKINFQENQTTAVLAVATSRKLFGSCSMDQAKYAALFWSGYDQSKNLVMTIKLFTIIDDVKNTNQLQNALFDALKNIIH